jgi:ABC-type transporter Mla subunit MlaD
MEQNNFILDLIASLLQSKSKKQIQEDIKNMGDIKFPLVGTLSPKTKAQLKKDIASLNGTVNLTGKIDNKGVATSVQQATTQAQKQVDSKPIDVSFSVKKDKLLNDIKLLAQQNSRLFKDNSMAVKYNSLLDSAEMARNTVELSTLRTQLGSFRSELKVTGNAGLTMTDALKNGFSKVLQLFGGHGIIKQFTAQLRNAWTEAKELDKSMTDLSRVSESLTRSGFPEYLDRVISKTKQLAVATKDYIDSVTTFSRAGYNLADSETLASAAIQLEKVGDMSAVDASKALLAGLQGYTEIDGYGMDQLIEKAQALNDKIDIIGNTASISQKEVAQGIQAVGSVMSDANTSVDEFIALLGAGNRAVQDSDKVALAIRTSALRIRGCSAELEEMGEETDNVYTSVSKLAEKIEGLTNINGSGGVKILEADEETFRSIYDIYNDISKVYDKMSDKDASALLDLIAGKNRSNQISAILQNMSEANVLLERSLNAAGTASEEYEIYLNSAEAASERFGVAMTEAYNSIINGETVKGLTNAGTAVLDFANSWNILEGTLKGFLALGVLKGVTTLTVAFKNSAVQVSNYGNALEAVKEIGVYAQGTEKYAEAMDTLTSSCVNLTDVQLKRILANRNLSESQLIEILQIKDLTEEQKEARLAQLGLIQTTETQAVAQGAATASTFSLSAAMKGLGASIKAAWAANPIGITIMAASVAIGVITSAISKYKESLEKANEATKEAIENFESITSEVESLDSKIEELNDQIDKLDPITDAEDIENLKLETEELNTQLAILKEKQRIAESDADKAAQSSLSMTQASRYQLEERESAYGGIEVGAAYVTKDEELLNAIEAYEKYKSKVDEANKALADMAETGGYSRKEWSNQEQIVTNYSEKMEEARSHANELATAISEQKQGLSGTTEESKALLDTIDSTITKYNEWLDAVNGVTAALDEQAESEKKVQEEAKNVTFEDAWADSFISESDAVRELGNTLLGLAEKGRLTKEIFEGADSNAGGYFKNLGISADEAVLKINKLVDESKQLSSMSSQISSMAEALGTKQENGFVEADTLAGFDVEVRGLDSWDRFQEVLGSTASSYEECQEAANALATEWVNSSDFLAQLTEQNEEYYKTQLESMGIENYEEVISYAHALNEAKEVLSQSSLMLGNATYDEIEALIAEGQYSELTANMILALYDAKIAEQAATLDTSADCANLIALAGDTDRTSQSIQLLIQLMNIYSGLESGVYGKNDFARTSALGVVTGIKAQLEALANGGAGKMEIEPTVKLGSKGKSSAKSAGKDAGKSYKEGLEEELSNIEGVISGITGKIDDQITTIKSQKEAALEAIDTQIDALNEQKSALEAQKKLLEEERDARIEIIEQQKKQLELAIKNIDKQIKEKEKIISGIQDEIKAMQDANAERQRQIDLQKALYDLERLQHQRTILQYSEEKGMHYVADTKGIRDAKDKVDDARLEIEIANKQKQIDLIEKEIDLLNEKKDAINEQIDILDEQIDQINEFYDAQIKAIDTQIEAIDRQIEALQKQKEETESYYESLIQSIEKSKSKYEELTDLVKQAELSAALKGMGIDEEALLNGSEEEFEKLKNAYLDIVFKLNEGNDEVLSSLKELSGYDGTAPSVLSESTDKLTEMNGQLDTSSQNISGVNNSLSETAAKTGEVSTNVADMNANLGEVSTLITAEQTAFDGLKAKIDEVIASINEKIAVMQAGQAATTLATTTEIANFILLKEKILEVKESLDTINTSVSTMDMTAVNNLTTSFQLLYDQLMLISAVLGAGMEGQEEGAVSGITSAIEALNNISLEDGIIAQFTNLKTAIDDVTSAIGGGGSGDSEGSAGGKSSGGSSSKSGSGESGGKGSKGEGEGGGNSLTGAIEEMGNKAKEVIGEEGAEGDGTVIGEFGSMKTAVNEVTTAIGSGDTEGGEGESSGGGEGEDSGNLIGSIVSLGETTQETLGEPDGDGVIGRFGEFEKVVEEAKDHVQGISEGLESIDGQEVECTITVNIVKNGDLPAFATGTALDTMNLNSAEYNAKYGGKAHYEGTAKVTGDWGVRDAGEALVGELGQEIIVRGSRFFTVGDNGAEFVNLQKGDIVFNHLQTQELLSKGNLVGRGKALASGTAYANGNVHVNGSAHEDETFITPLEYIHMLQQKSIAKRAQTDPNFSVKEAYEKLEKINANLEHSFKALTQPTHIIADNIKRMIEMGSNGGNAGNVNNVTNNSNVQQPVNNVFNITMPNVTNATSADALMKDLQSLAMKRSQVKW